MSAVLVGLVAGLVAPAPVAADHYWGVEFGAGSARPTYGEGIVFTQEIVLDAEVRRIELLLSFPREPGSFVIEIPIPETRGRTTLRYDYALATDGHLLPNTPIVARWLATSADGLDTVGSEPVEVTYRDTRFEWRTRQGDIVRIHWYEGDDAFGERALEIGERAVRETAELLGVRETEPIDFFVYADEESFRAALGPATRENVGGQANAENRTLFALIRPSEIDQPWVGIVIPHELVHLVFNTTVDNAYHFPPRWLNEGLAVYLSQGYDASDRAAVEAAASSGELIPLQGLTGQFPTTSERFALAYAESVSAVDYLVRQYGREALIQLIRSYSAGRTDAEAFEQAIEIDVAAFDTAWRADLGAADPVVHGPQPAAAGPIPPGWSGGAVPGASPVPTAAAPTAAAQPSAASEPGAGGQATGIAGVFLPIALILVVVVGTVAVIRIRMRPGRSAL